jgi:hypothetical protein
VNIKPTWRDRLLLWAVLAYLTLVAAPIVASFVV